MGKKRIIKKSGEELLRERETVEAKIQKGMEAAPSAQKVREGRVYIFASYNNTLITLTDLAGNVLGWASAGNIGFKGTKKSTPFAASKVAEAISQTAKKIGLERIEVRIKGIGSGRESALRSLAARGLNIVSIKDVTPVPHNGCRPPKSKKSVKLCV